MEKSVREFLRKRGIDIQTIDRMEENKIDCHVIQLIDDESLMEYLPQQGDRIALKGFCKNYLNDKASSSSDRKNALFASLRKKLKMKENGDTDENPRKKTHLSGNKNAKKSTRKIELGWLNYDSSSHLFKQVRKRNGGGTRKLDVDKECDKDDLEERAKALFFPNGESKMGAIENFLTEMRDFSEDLITSTETVGEMYQRTGMNILRFFLATTLRNSESKVDIGTHLTAANVSTLTHTSPLNVSVSSTSSSDSLPSLINSVHSGTTKVPITSTQQSTLNSLSTVDFSNTESMNPGHLSTTPAAVADSDPTADATLNWNEPVSKDTPDKMDLLDNSETEIFFRVLEESISEQNSTTLPYNSSDSNSEETNISLLNNDYTPLKMNIHRGPMAFKELIGYFKDPTIAKRQLIITRILPNGDSELAEDTGGVWRDLLTEFWSHFYDHCTMGRDAKVPCLRHDFGEEEWIAVGRILSHGYKFVNYWPVQLARCFTMSCIISNGEVTSSDLLEDFYNYVSIPDKDVFQKAVADYDAVDKDDLFEALDMHNGKLSPTKDNIKSILLEMAHKELIQTPMFVCNCWQRCFATMNITTTTIDEIYSALILTNKKVVQALAFPEEMDAQANSVAVHLKRYVKNLEKQKLGLFMRYCTGSDLLTVDKISVEFTVMSGLQRRPIAHTCACMLQLSKTYESFMDFRTEFDNILSGNVWVMDIV